MTAANAFIEYTRGLRLDRHSHERDPKLLCANVGLQSPGAELALPHGTR